MSSDLNAAILRAHADDDRAALVTLYARAADRADAAPAAGYFLTLAYVFALETSAPAAGDLHARLRAMGREA